MEADILECLNLAESFRKPMNLKWHDAFSQCKAYLLGKMKKPPLLRAGGFTVD